MGGVISVLRIFSKRELFDARIKMVSSTEVKSVPLNDGSKIPIVGLGTWQSKLGQVSNAVKAAIDAGYRHIDGAFIYENEKELGEGLHAKIKDETIKREDVFITTKVWNTYHSRAKVMECLKQSLELLQLKYVDLALVHWPMSFKEGGEVFPKDEADNDKMAEGGIDITETWLGMEDCQKAGLCKSIGLSNFNVEQTKEIMAMATIKPVLNQVESHPWLVQTELLAYLKEAGVAMQAYSPLGAPKRPWVKEDDPVLLDDASIKAIAEKHAKSPAQVCIRFQVQRGVIPLPKSVTESRIQSNLDVFNFELSAEEMKTLEGLDKGKEGRACHLRTMTHLKHYPFSNEV